MQLSLDKRLFIHRPWKKLTCSAQVLFFEIVGMSMGGYLPTLPGLKAAALDGLSPNYNEENFDALVDQGFLFVEGSQIILAPGFVSVRQNAANAQNHRVRRAAMAEEASEQPAPAARAAIVEEPDEPIAPVKLKVVKPPKPEIPVAEIGQLYNRNLSHRLSSIREIKGARRNHVVAFWKEMSAREADALAKQNIFTPPTDQQVLNRIARYFAKAAAIPFYVIPSENPKHLGWTADFDFLMRQDTIPRLDQAQLAQCDQALALEAKDARAAWDEAQNKKTANANS